MPLLWILLVCTTGLMGERSTIDTYSFGTIHGSSSNIDIIEYTPNSPAKAILNVFIPEGTNPYTDIEGVTRNLYEFALKITHITFPRTDPYPNTYILITVIYMFYLFVIQICILAVDLVSLPIRLCSKFLEGVG